MNTEQSPTLRDLEIELQRAFARKIVPNASDAAIDSVYEIPMTRDQRIAALKGIA